MNNIRRITAAICLTLVGGLLAVTPVAAQDDDAGRTQV